MNAAFGRFNNAINSRSHREGDTQDLPSLKFVQTGVVQDSADAMANQHYNEYRDGKLYAELKDVVGKYYGTINRMSFASLVTVLPEAKQYISFLGGAHKFKSKEEEFHAKMQYMAAFGALASYGINLLRNKMTVANGANRKGVVDFDNPTSFKDAYADLLDILPGAIHTAIATYDGVRVKMEKSAKEPQAVASLNTWFYYVLENKYQQYLVDRGGDSIILAKVAPKQLYSVTGDLFIGADEDKQTVQRIINEMSLYNMPRELHEYGMKKFADALPWFLSQYTQPQQGIKSTGRREIIAAVNNEMVRGPYAEELGELLNKFKKTGEGFDDYAQKFIYAFSDAFLSVVNTEEGDAAWHAYRTMQKLGNIKEDIIKTLQEVPEEIELRANEYGKSFIMQAAYGIDDRKESQADLDLKAYVNRLHDAFVNDVVGNKSLTREGRAVAISKASIIAEALDLAEAAKDRYKQTDNEEVKKQEAKNIDRRKSKIRVDRITKMMTILEINVRIKLVVVWRMKEVQPYQFTMTLQTTTTLHLKEVLIIQ